MAPSPLYFQPKLWILAEINKGNLTPGDRIPSELQLCQRFGLSRGTVRQALAELKREGRIYLLRGRGTFVAEPPLWSWSIGAIVSISDTFQQEGLTFGTHVLEFEPRAADAAVATRLNMRVGSKVLFLKRLRSVEGEPFMVSTSYLPEKLASGLYSVDLENHSLYKALGEACGIQVSHVDRTLGVRLASADEAELLGVQLPTAIHLLEGVAYDAHGRPVEFSQGIYRGDKSRFELQSKRIV